MGKASFPEFCILSISFRRSQGGKKTMFASRNVKRIFNSLFSLQHKPNEMNALMKDFTIYDRILTTLPSFSGLSRSVTYLHHLFVSLKSNIFQQMLLLRIIQPL